jgi:hypothetical protein
VRAWIYDVWVWSPDWLVWAALLALGLCWGFVLALCWAAAADRYNELNEVWPPAPTIVRRASRPYDWATDD